MKSGEQSKKSQPAENLAAGTGKQTVIGRKNIATLVEGDVIAFIWSDERPLGGLIGLWDWYQCGRISALLQERHLVGDLGEQLLTALTVDDRYCRLFVFGLGPLAKFTADSAEKAINQAQNTLAAAGSKKARVLLPVSRLQPDFSTIFQHALQAHPLGEVLVSGIGP